MLASSDGASTMPLLKWIESARIDLERAAEAEKARREKERRQDRPRVRDQNTGN